MIRRFKDFREKIPEPKKEPVPKAPSGPVDPNPEPWPEPREPSST